MVKKFVNREAFLSPAQNLKRAGMELEGIGMVGVRELNGRQILIYNQRIRQMMEKDSKVNPENAMEIIALLVSMSVCDDEGNLLFTEEDVTALMEASFDSLIKIAGKATELSGLSKEKSGEVSSSLKNALTSSSTTDSPRSSESP